MHNRSNRERREEQPPSNRTNPVILLLLRIRIHVIRGVRCHDFQAVPTRVRQNGRTHFLWVTSSADLMVWHLERSITP